MDHGPRLLRIGPTARRLRVPLKWLASEAEAGRVYLLSAFLGDPEPARGRPPQRHIPRSRALGTTWWELEESDWYVRIEQVAEWASLEGPVAEERRAR